MDWSETLTVDQENLERWMLALRLDTGFPKTWLESQKQIQQADQLKRQGLIEEHPVIPKQLRLTPKGFALSDQIIASLA